MEWLRLQRWEVSRASSEAGFLNALRLNSMEYGLVRQLDLSFDDSPLLAFYSRMYWRQSESLQNLANEVSQSDYYLTCYYNELAQFYYALSDGYYSLAYSVDPHSVSHTDLKTPELLGADLQTILETGLIPRGLQQAPQEVKRMLQSQTSLKAYKQEIDMVDGALQKIPALVSNPNKSHSFVQQLECLKYFYNQVHTSLNTYYNPLPAIQYSEIMPRVADGNGHELNNRQQDYPPPVVNNTRAMIHNGDSTKQFVELQMANPLI